MKFGIIIYIYSSYKYNALIHVIYRPIIKEGKPIEIIRIRKRRKELKHSANMRTPYILLILLILQILILPLKQVYAMP